MENKRISEMIFNYKEGDITVLEQLWSQLLPLIKKYAGKTYFMEYEDAYQEYSLTLFEAVDKIQKYDTDGQCLKYIVTCMKNKFCFLYKNYCNTIANETANDILIIKRDELEILDPYNDIVFWSDVNDFIMKLSSATKRIIANLSIVHQKNDVEIASYLGVSRQYVNKIKRELFQKLSSDINNNL